MFKKGTKLYSIFNFKCPKCHEGDFFVGHPYSLKNTGKDTGKCNVCGCEYSPEPGFYYGAMYVSYALGVAMFVGVFLIVYLLVPEPSATLYVVAILLSMVLLGPLLYSLSKIIWANMFIHYNKEKKQSS